MIDKPTATQQKAARLICSTLQKYAETASQHKMLTPKAIYEKCESTKELFFWFETICFNAPLVKP